MLVLMLIIDAESADVAHQSFPCDLYTESRRAACVLDAVAAMDKPEGFEVIVVDNASHDGTADVIQRYVTVSDFVVKYAFEPAVGLANARNCGWHMARGDIVAFTDDDCYVASFTAIYKTPSDR
jgi:glycosyltransferase involved in cell wall biosynthesis